MKLKIDRSSPVPLHRQAEVLLRELITKDEYKEGKMLPNEVELSEQLKISRNTLRQSINTLVNEGLLIRKKGVGTRVAEKNLYSEATNWLSFSQEMGLLGIKIENFELHISKQPPTENAIQFFDLPADLKILRMERLRGKENFPFVYFHSEFNPKIQLSGTENFNRPLYEILEKDYNILVRTSREEIRAAGANPFIAAKLEIEVGDPILIRKRFVSDINNLPIEYNVGWYRADSFSYKIESVRESKFFSSNPSEKY
ncbi:MAG: GntR family transcriptional regulator [Bacteroidia bacterium]|nr:GntR family transcriptional regulator [Bacteroidia bacterium]